MKPIREALQNDGTKPVWYDGAKGTEFQKFLAPGAPSEPLNLTNPEAVLAVHTAYVEAGCQIIQTNTFGATRLRLALHNPDITDAQVREINESGARLAKRAAVDRAYVAGNIGPSGKVLEPAGDTKPEDLITAFKTQTEGLISGGVDLIHIETMIDINEAIAAIAAIREVSPNIPIMVTMSFNYHNERGFRTDFGDTPQKLVTLADEKGLLASGANCGGKDIFPHAGNLIKQLQSANPNAVIVAKLNAGVPILVGGEVQYPQATSETLAVYARTVHEAGAKIIGACCGSTPKLLREVINSFHSDTLLHLARPRIPTSSSHETIYEETAPNILTKSLTEAVNELIEGNLAAYHAILKKMNIRKLLAVKNATTKDITQHLLLALRAHDPLFFDMALERIGGSYAETLSKSKKRENTTAGNAEIMALYKSGSRLRRPDKLLNISQDIADKARKVHPYAIRFARKALERAEKIENQEMIHRAKRQLGLFALGFANEPSGNFSHVTALCEQANSALVHQNILGTSELADQVRAQDPLLAFALDRRAFSLPDAVAKAQSAVLRLRHWAKEMDKTHPVDAMAHRNRADILQKKLRRYQKTQAA